MHSQNREKQQASPAVQIVTVDEAGVSNVETTPVSAGTLAGNEAARQMLTRLRSGMQHVFDEITDTADRNEAMQKGMGNRKKKGKKNTIPKSLGKFREK